MKYFRLLILILISCNTSNKSMNLHCTKASAIEIADQFMRKRHFKLSYYNKEIVETNNDFRIEYISKDSISLGGRAVLKISKSDCRIVKKILFQ